MTRWKVLAAAFAVFAAPALTAAQDITGAWEVTIDSPQGAMNFDAEFTQNGENVAGKLNSPMGAVDFKGLLIKDALTVNYKVDMQGNELDITMSGLVDDAGTAMTGNVVITGLGEIPWTAKRKPAGAVAAAEAAAAAAAAAAAPATAAAAAAGDVTGKWDFALSLEGQGIIPIVAVLTQTGEKVTGTLATPMGETPVTGTMVGQALKLDFVTATPQGDIAVEWTGDLGPEGFTGKASLAGLGDAAWTGKRAVQ